MVPLLASVPPPMPGDICIEVLWELIHSPVIAEHERPALVENLADICAESIPVPNEWPMDPQPKVIPPDGWYPWGE